jgi:hypothetical protein
MPYFNPSNAYGPLIVGCPNSIILNLTPTPYTATETVTRVDIATSVESTSGWFQGDVFVTPVGDLTALENVPDLVTVYTQPLHVLTDGWSDHQQPATQALILSTLSGRWNLKEGSSQTHCTISASFTTRLRTVLEFVPVVKLLPQSPHMKASYRM